jgi:hypothetical protein
MMRILRKNALYGESRFPRNLKIYIEETVFPKLTEHIKKDTICEKTCQNYMHKWRFKYNEKKVSLL